MRIKFSFEYENVLMLDALMDVVAPVEAKGEGCIELDPDDYLEIIMETNRTFPSYEQFKEDLEEELDYNVDLTNVCLGNGTEEFYNKLKELYNENPN